MLTNLIVVIISQYVCQINTLYTLTLHMLYVNHISIKEIKKEPIHM